MHRLNALPHKALAAASLALLLVACSEQPQTAGTRADATKAWQGKTSGFAAPGWKPGDQASWNEQIKQRNRGQNDYARTSP